MIGTRIVLKRGGKDEPEKPFWISFSDLMTALMVLVLVATLIPLGFWLRLAYPLYGIALILVALVPLIGIENMGARRWLGFAGMSFQPG